MSCNNCDGTIWFNHATKRWVHSTVKVDGPKTCTKPEPRILPPSGTLSS